MATNSQSGVGEQQNKHWSVVAFCESHEQEKKMAFQLSRC